MYKSHIVYNYYLPKINYICNKINFTNYLIIMRTYSNIINLYLLLLAPLFFTGCSDEDRTFGLLFFLITFLLVGGIAFFIFFQEHKKNESAKKAVDSLGPTFSVCKDTLKPETLEPKYAGRLLYADLENKKIAMVKASMTGHEQKIVDNFEFSYSRVCPYQIFAFDETNRSIEIFDFRNDITSERIKFEDIHSVSLLIDDVTIYSKSSSRTFGGALVGGALLGAAGAVVGGLSGDTKVNDKVKSIKIKILVKDPSNPTRTITLLSGAEFEMSIAKPYIEDGTAVQDTIRIIIDRIDKEEAAKTKSLSSFGAPSSITSVSDELLKLAELKEKGILTEEEFQTQKQKVLNL